MKLSFSQLVGKDKQRHPRLLPATAPRLSNVVIHQNIGMTKLLPQLDSGSQAATTFV
jgi:hypothetical protein